MSRAIVFASVFAGSGLSLMGANSAGETSTVTRSDRGNNHAEIIQSGPEDGKPDVEIEEGPGYVVVKQRSKNNNAVIIQGTGREK